MPAAAVIPAPIAYTKVVAVKKLVVGFMAVPGVQFLVHSGTAILGGTCVELSFRAEDAHRLL